MPRTTTALVEEVLAGDYDALNQPSLNPYVASATVVVSRVKTCASNKGITLTDEELELIERWLAAHMYCAFDKPLASKSTGGASGSFQGQTGMNLDATNYGQRAKLIDYSGCLAAIDKRQFASFGWLGKTVPEQLDYDERN